MPPGATGVMGMTPGMGMPGMGGMGAPGSMRHPTDDGIQSLPVLMPVNGYARFNYKFMYMSEFIYFTKSYIN